MLSGAFLFVASVASAQTDYYNLDAGRPLRIEDALVIERHAFELQGGSTLSFLRGRAESWRFLLELAWGLLPRTQLEVGAPILLSRGDGVEVDGVELSVLHALNTETLTWPALALRVGAHVPGSGSATTSFDVGALTTRTFTHGRLHANAAVIANADEAARWSAGIAGDRTFVVRSLLIGAEVMMEEAELGGGRRWSSSLGLRKQIGPRQAIDIGVGRVFGPDGEWFVTFGRALSFGLLHRFGGAR